MSAAVLRKPIVTIQVPDDVVSGHNGIFTHAFVDLILRMSRDINSATRSRARLETPIIESQLFPRERFALFQEAFKIGSTEVVIRTAKTHPRYILRETWMPDLETIECRSTLSYRYKSSVSTLRANVRAAYKESGGVLELPSDVLPSATRAFLVASNGFAPSHFFFANPSYAPLHVEGSQILMLPGGHAVVAGQSRVTLLDLSQILVLDSLTTKVSRWFRSDGQIFLEALGQYYRVDSANARFQKASFLPTTSTFISPHYYGPTMPRCQAYGEEWDGILETDDMQVQELLAQAPPPKPGNHW